MAHHVGRRRGSIGERLDMLMVVNFDEGDSDPVGARLVERCVFVEAEQVVPKADGLGQVCDEIAHMREAGNFGALGRGVLGMDKRSDQEQTGGKEVD
jgi:hypothetical protein